MTRTEGAVKFGCGGAVGFCLGFLVGLRRMVEPDPSFAIAIVLGLIIATIFGVLAMRM